MSKAGRAVLRGVFYLALTAGAFGLGSTGLPGRWAAAVITWVSDSAVAGEPD